MLERRSGGGGVRGGVRRGWGSEEWSEGERVSDGERVE